MCQSGSGISDPFGGAGEGKFGSLVNVGTSCGCFFFVFLNLFISLNQRSGWCLFFVIFLPVIKNGGTILSSCICISWLFLGMDFDFQLLGMPEIGRFEGLELFFFSTFLVLGYSRVNKLSILLGWNNCTCMEKIEAFPLNSALIGLVSYKWSLVFRGFSRWDWCTIVETVSVAGVIWPWCQNCRFHVEEEGKGVDKDKKGDD